MSAQVSLLRPERSLAPTSFLADAPWLLLASLAAIAIQGYHLGTDDGEIYLPAIKQALHPELYPEGAAFFQMHGHMSHMAGLVSGFARLTHTTADFAILFWYCAGMFLLLLAGLRLAQCLFTHRRAAWGAVAVLALTLCVPAAGTALFLADPYLTARSLSTPLSLLAIAAFLRGRWWQTAVWLLLTGLVHPQMVVYTAGLLLFLSLPFPSTFRIAAVRERVPARLATVLAAPQSLLDTFSLRPTTGAYHDVLYTRTFFFVSMWAWQEWFGVFAPLAFMVAYCRLPLRGVTATFHRVCRSLIAFGLFSTLVAIVIAASTRFDTLARLQPMRSFHTIYIFFFLMLGGLIAEYLLKDRWQRWALFYVPLAAAMLAVSLAMYPASPHVELPGRAEGDPWLETFYWIRTHTPVQAIFAIDPAYTRLPLEDEHGFRAGAERSVLADTYKDSGATVMFPVLLPEYMRESDALRGWGRFTLTDFKRLEHDFGVTWVVLDKPVPGLACTYRNGPIEVCPLD